MREQTKRCFISYSYDGIDRDKLDYLIHVLKDRLGHNTQILYDQDLEIGDNISRFMKFLDTVDVVIVILTPSYKRKVNDCQGGVYNEFCRIWGRYSGSTFEGSEPLLGEDSPRFKLIPILFSGSLYDSTPQEISDLLFLDLTDLKVTRKSNGQFQIPHHMQRSVGSKMQALASEIVAAIAVKSPSFKKLSASYYDRLFVDLKAKFDDPTFALSLIHI